MTILKTIAKAGRKYKVNDNGAEDVTKEYQLVLSAPLGIDDLPIAFSTLPALGTEHPNRRGYCVVGYDVEQPDGAARNTLNVTVRYGPLSSSTSSEGITETITEWGWDDSTSEVDLVTSRDNPPKDVLNSAKDPFDSAPKVSVPTPVFTKVVKRSARFAGYPDLICKVNNAAVTIGAMTCAAGTLLCTIAERILIGETRFPFEYTIKLRYRSNIVNVGDSNQEVGWAAAVVDAGMREVDQTTGKKKLITVMSEETGREATVTSPALLDGQGHHQTSASASPVILVFGAYAGATFPNWLYSEPTLPPQPSGDDDEE